MVKNMSIYKYGMLVFCKQLQRAKCLVYCVELDTLDDVAPRVHCFSAPFFRFTDMEPGQVYRFEVKGTLITRMIPEGFYKLTETDFSLLQELRFRRFEARSGETFHEEDYFSYQELCSLIAYREPLLYRFGLFLLRSAAYVLAGLIPVGLYTLLVYACFSDKERIYSGLIIALGALPFMIFMVILLYTVAEALLMQWKRTRYGLLRSFALRGCGAKHRMGVKRSAARRLVYIGAATFAVFAVTAVLTLLI